MIVIKMLSCELIAFLNRTGKTFQFLEKLLLCKQDLEHGDSQSLYVTDYDPTTMDDMTSKQDYFYHSNSTTVCNSSYHSFQYFVGIVQ